MLSGKAQAATAPTALGSLLQAATYGQTIPTIYGMTMSPLLAIWAANLRKGVSNKKLKNFISKLKGQTGYEENIDFLLGHNPIMGVQQMWNNGAPIPLAFTSQTFTASQFGGTEFTVTDAHFYAVIGVTFIQNYSASFNDYGGTGPQTVTGSYEIPLWNELQVGPDPTDPNSYRNYPNVYRWQPSYGTSIFVDALNQGTLGGNPNPTTLKVYYSQLIDATSFLPPIQKMRLEFEPELGSGSEYADAGLSSQQVIYPMYAGMGSSDIDLGSGAAIPQLQAEIQGKFGLYSTGDADFADMIEDVFKSGIAQAAIGADTAYTRVEHGLSGYDLPGCVQKKVANSFENFPAINAFSFNAPNTAGNVLLMFMLAAQDGPSPWPAGTISDSLGNTYIQYGTGDTAPAFDSATVWTLWYCVDCIGGSNTVTFGNRGFSGTTYVMLELAGVDALDGFDVTVGAHPTASVTTTNTTGCKASLIAFSFQGATPEATAGIGSASLWETIIDPSYFSWVLGSMFVQQLNVSNAGTYSLSWKTGYAAPDPTNVLALIAFKASNPSSSPEPVGDFMDLDSLDQVRLQCRANGLYGSLSMNSQQSASDWLDTLYTAADAAPVFMGFKLFSFPYSEVSVVGNGAVYTATTASGPLANLSDLNGDFVGSDVPIKVKTSARVDQDNVLQMQCINRTSNYNPSLVSQPDAASISLYGVRKQDPVTNNAVQDVAIARQLLGIQVRNLQYGGDVYSFTMSVKWCLLAPMDLVTVTDTLVAIFSIPVRLTSITEQDDFSMQCTASPFVYGMNAPTVFTTDQPVPFQPNPTGDAGDVNTPIFFEPVPQLIALQNQGQLWVVVSSNNPNYGGCQVYISTDGGGSYNAIGNPLVGSATTGVTTADWPASSDPDTTNNLPLDLTESNGSLLSYSFAQEENFVYPCYVSGGGQSIPYELMTYEIATLTAANHYTLMATGSGNQLRRGVFGAPESGVGVDHPSGSRFAFLDPSGQGILKINLQPTWVVPQTGRIPLHAYLLGDEIVTENNSPANPDQLQKVTTAGTSSSNPDPVFSGTLGGTTTDGTVVWTNQGYAPGTLFFKIVSFNTFGGSPQSLSDVAVYTYTPIGTSGSGPQLFQVNGS